ncbi:GtrA family protein [Blastococcus sp. SYSU D00820]
MNAHADGAPQTPLWRTLVKEGGAFVVVGGFCFLLDVGLFQLLYAELGVGAVTSKLVSTVISVWVSYYAHRYWSFSHRERTGPKRELTVFFVVNVFTLLLSLGIVALVRYPLGQDSPLVLQAANLSAIALGTLIRFLSYRRWVFVASDHPAARIAERPEPQDLRAAA